MADRDRGLDLLKGAACILMVFAHGRVEDNGQLPVLLLKFLGQFAPVLFFSVSGITAYMQGRRKSLLHLIIFYFWFFIAGFSHNGILVSDYWHVAQSDILQCIALSTMLMVLFSKVIREKALFLLVPIPFILHSLLQRWDLLSWFPYQPFIIPPGIFPLLPWLSFFLLGAACYAMDWKWNTAFSGAVLALLALSARYEFAGDLTNKWNMSLRFFLLASAGIFLSMALLKLFKGKLRCSPVEYMGRYSLLFLYCHYIPVLLLEQWEIKSPLMVWPIILVTTFGMMVLLIKLNKWIPGRIRQSPYSWLAVTLMVILAPYLFRYKVTVYTLSMVVGIWIALNYHHMNQVIDGLKLGSKRAAAEKTA